MTDAEKIARAAAKRERRAARDRATRCSLADLDDELQREAAQLTDRHERAWHVDATHEADLFQWEASNSTRDLVDDWDYWLSQKEASYG